MTIDSKLYACIISEAGKDALTAVASEFSYGIEMLEDGVLFNVSGLERLIGKPSQVAQKILDSLKQQNIPGSIAVADTVDTALILARQKKGLQHAVAAPEEFQKLPLSGLGIENDAIGIFNELGIDTVEKLRRVPVDDLIDRYGRQFRDVIDLIEQKGKSFLTPNIKESNVAWDFDLDFAVDDFEQLIFIINHGLDHLFARVAHHGFSTEHLDISFQLHRVGRSPHDSKGTVCTSPRVSKGVTSNLSDTPLLTRAAQSSKTYEIKTSFPALEKAFWLKLINLRVSLDPPETGIVSVGVVAHFTKPRPNQHGLYAINRPEPESLLLTVGKLKKLVGEENVGVPVLLNQRLAEPFALDDDKMPDVMTAETARISNKLRLSRSICGEARFADETKNDFAAMPPLSANSSGIAVDHLFAVPERHSLSANRAAKPPTPVIREVSRTCGIIAITYFRPPVRAEVLVREGRLVYIKTRHFGGHVIGYSGVWKTNSKWWSRDWRTLEWDVEVENHGVYRLCKGGDECFLVGEYD